MAEDEVRRWLAERDRSWVSCLGEVIESFRNSSLGPDEWIPTLLSLESQNQVAAYIESVRTHHVSAGMMEALREFPLFGELNAPTSFFESISGVLVPRELDDGAMIIRAGDVDDEMYFLKTGEVQVLVGNRVVASLGPGAYFGESALMSQEPRNASIRAVGTVNLLVLSKDGLVGTFQRFPDVGNLILGRMEAKATETKEASALEMSLEQWLNERDLGAYLAPVITTFKKAEYKADEMLSELVEMEKDGTLHAYMTSVKKHYHPTGDRIEEVFIASAKKKLALVPLLAKLTQADPKFLDSLQEKLQLTSLPAGAIVVRKGEVGESMFFILSGRVRIFDSFDKPPLASLGAGKYFGEAALLTSEPRNAFIQAFKPVQLFALSRHGLEAVLAKFPRVKSVLEQETQRRREATKTASSQGPLQADQFRITFEYPGPLGLTLGSDGPTGRPRIKTVKPNTMAAAHPDAALMRNGIYLRSVDGDNVKTYNASIDAIRAASRPVILAFQTEVRYF